DRAARQKSFQYELGVALEIARICPFRSRRRWVRPAERSPSETAFNRRFLSKMQTMKAWLSCRFLLTLPAPADMVICHDPNFCWPGGLRRSESPHLVLGRCGMPAMMLPSTSMVADPTACLCGDSL